MENLLIEQVIARIQLLTIIEPIDKVCLDFYYQLRQQTGDGLPLVTEILRNYQTKNAEEDAIKFGLLYYLDLHNKEVG